MVLYLFCSDTRNIQAMDVGPDAGGAGVAGAPVPMIVGPVAGTVVGAGAGVVPMDVEPAPDEAMDTS